MTVGSIPREDARRAWDEWDRPAGRLVDDDDDRDDDDHDDHDLYGRLVSSLSSLSSSSSRLSRRLSRRPRPAHGSGRIYPSYASTTRKRATRERDTYDDDS